MIKQWNYSKYDVHMGNTDFSFVGGPFVEWQKCILCPQQYDANPGIPPNWGTCQWSSHSFCQDKMLAVFANHWYDQSHVYRSKAMCYVDISTKLVISWCQELESCKKRMFLSGIFELMVVVTEAGILSQNMIFFKPWRVFLSLHLTRAQYSSVTTNKLTVKPN